MSRPDAAVTVVTRNGAIPTPTAPQRPDQGITAAELVRRVPPRAGVDRLSPDGLEAWLLGAGLAERDGRPDLLVPTALELGSGDATHAQQKITRSSGSCDR